MAKKFTLAGNEKFISLLKDDFIPNSMNPKEDYDKKYHIKFSNRNKFSYDKFYVYASK